MDIHFLFEQLDEAVYICKQNYENTDYERSLSNLVDVVDISEKLNNALQNLVSLEG